MEAFILKPCFEIQLTQRKSKIKTFKCYLSTDYKWWVNRETMLNVFGYGERDLQCLIEDKDSTFYVEDESVHYYNLSKIFSNDGCDITREWFEYEIIS